MKKSKYRLLIAGILLFISSCNVSGNLTNTPPTTAAEPAETQIAETVVTESPAENDSDNPNVAIFGTFEADLNNDGIMEVYTTVAVGMCTNFIDMFINGYDPNDDTTYVLQHESRSDLRFCIHNEDLYVMETVPGERRRQIYVPSLDTGNKTFLLEPVNREMELDVLRDYYAQRGILYQTAEEILFRDAYGSQIYLDPYEVNETEFQNLEFIPLKNGEERENPFYDKNGFNRKSIYQAFHADLDQNGIYETYINAYGYLSENATPENCIYFIQGFDSSDNTLLSLVGELGTNYRLCMFEQRLYLVKFDGYLRHFDHLAVYRPLLENRELILQEVDRETAYQVISPLSDWWGTQFE